MKNRGLASLLLVIVATMLPRTVQSQAQQTPIPEKPSIAPQIELDGTGIATFEVHSPQVILPSGARTSTTRINISDSALLLGVSERLFRSGGIGSFVFGGILDHFEKADRLAGVILDLPEIERGGTAGERCVAAERLA